MQWLVRGWVEADPGVAGVALAAVVALTVAYLLRRARR